MPEEDYVLSGVAGVATRGAPLRAAENRLRQRRPPLLDGCHVYLQGPFSPALPLSKPELARAIRAGGGVVLTREPDPEAVPEDERRHPYHASLSAGHPLAKCSHYIVYQDGGPKGFKEPELKYNMEHVKSLPVSWLLACFREFKLLAPNDVPKCQS